MTLAGSAGKTAATVVLIWPVLALSCGILGFEIALMRVLLYSSWHHFAFLVISVVLLGFGASGTVLCFLRSWLMRRGEGAFFLLVLATAVAIPVSVRFAQHIPVEARFVPALLLRQVSLWVVYWATLSVPFLLGATALGLALMHAGKRLPTVYAANLVGSAVGAGVATVAMHVLPPAWLAPLMGAITLVGAAALANPRGSVRAASIAVAVFGIASWMWLDPPRIRVDPYKYLAYVHRLENEDKATRLASAYGPRAVIETFAGDSFHDLPFLGGGETPPPIIPVVIDGHGGGSLLNVKDASGARVVDQTLMSLPYAFVRPSPRVLLLGETGGANVWLALRNAASSVHVVQPNGQLADLLTGPLRQYGGFVFDAAHVSMIREEPRHFVEHSALPFDLIQLASMESWAVETGGVGGLVQDYLVTVEGLNACLERLSPNGILAVGRGLQLPPRDNVKLLNTLIAAMRRLGIEEPERHVVILRDYLAACTMIKMSPWTAADIDRVRETAVRRELTPVYFYGVLGRELNYPDRLPGPVGEEGDWLHHAARELFSEEADVFIDEWAFDIRAPIDDRPFFANFTKLKAIDALKQAFGDLWLTRTELALLFVMVAMSIVALAAVLLTIFPLGLIGDIRCSPGLGVTAIYFSAIGLGYLMIEITILSRLIHLIGDPVQAGAVVIAGFLFFSGGGSLLAQRLAASGSALVPVLLLLLVAVGVIDAWLIEWVTTVAGSRPVTARFLVVIAVIGPLAFLMGIPMPSALERLQKRRPVLIPWSWGVNGFASVLAPPLATAVGMIAGFRIAGALALVLYLVAAMTFKKLPAAEARGQSLGGSPAVKDT
ncbi:MAG: hypothetical protein OEN01_01525 [Candidatus Krumholzibacteria bacterium]|nr:hypothetical protein [Candidatus Krumholzibacteria bacterium]